MRLQASNVPDLLIGEAIERMRVLGIPVKQSTLIRAAIAAFAGRDDSIIREIAIRRPERKRAELSLDHFLREANDDSTPV